MRRVIFNSLISILIICIVQLHAQNKDAGKFNLSLGTKYLSRFTAYGIDLADDNPAWRLTGSISHKSGFYSDASFTSPLNTTQDAHQLGFDVGYEREVLPWISLSAEYSRLFAASDTLNLLSEFSSSFSLNADLSFSFFDIGFSFDQFLGNLGAFYFSFDISSFQEIGSLYILPLLQVVFISQEVDNSKLPKSSKKNKRGNQPSASVLDETTTLTGLANTTIAVVTIWPVYKNLSLSFTPTLILSHQDDLSDESAQFIWNIGARYRLNF